MGKSAIEANKTRSRFPARVIVTLLLLGLAITVFRFSPAYGTFRFMRYYGEAESFVERVLVLRNELKTDGHRVLRQILDSPEFLDLRKREMKIDLDVGELVRFQVNEMFDIGLEKDGAITWHSN